MTNSVEDYSLIVTILYFSLYAVVFLIASITAALSVRKQIKKRKLTQNQIKLSIDQTSAPNNTQTEDTEKNTKDSEEKEILIEDANDEEDDDIDAIDDITDTAQNGDKDWKWYTPVKIWAKSIQQKRKIYISLLPHIFDQATDFGVVFEYYYIWRLGDKSDINKQVNTLYLFATSIFVLTLHRIVSGYAVYRLTHKWCDVMLQMFDLLMVKCVYINYQLDIDEPSNSQRYLQVLEATFESSPQLLIAMGYLAKIGLSKSSPIIIISTIASLFSLTARIASDDKAMFIQKMQTLDFNYKALKQLDLSLVINFWYVLRVVLWRFVEMTMRIFLCTLIWINLGGLALFLILGVEFAYISYVCFKLKTIDLMGFMVYITFASGSINNVEQEEDYIFESSITGKIFTRDIYVLIIGGYRIISNWIYLLLVTIFATTRFQSPKVPSYDDRHEDTMEDGFVLFMLIYSWLGSFFWPISMVVSAIANDGALRSNARDILKLVQNGYVLEILQLIEFGTECPYHELCNVFNQEKRIVIARRLVSNRNPKTWDLVLKLLHNLDLNEEMVNKPDHDGGIELLNEITQSASIYGGTILHYAVVYSSYEVIKYLITQKHADTTKLCENKQHSMYYYAMYKRDNSLPDSRKIIKLLNKYIRITKIMPADYNWQQDQDKMKKERDIKKKKCQIDMNKLKMKMKETTEMKKRNEKKIQKMEELREKLNKKKRSNNFKQKEKELKCICNGLVSQIKKEEQSDTYFGAKCDECFEALNANSLYKCSNGHVICGRCATNLYHLLKDNEYVTKHLEINKIKKLRKHDDKIKNEMEPIQQQIDVIMGEEREEHQQKAVDLLMTAARKTLPTAPILGCLALLPIVFLLLSIIGSVMTIQMLFDDDICNKNCLDGSISNLRINHVNIDAYRFEAVILVIFAILECCVAIPCVGYAITYAFDKRDENDSWKIPAALTGMCNLVFIVLEIIIMFHFYIVFESANCINENVGYSLTVINNLFDTWVVITILIILFVMWIYCYGRRIALEYSANAIETSNESEFKISLFYISNLSNPNTAFPLCCGACFILIWILLTISTMIMSATTILEFNENCFRFNGSAKIEFSALFLIDILALLIPIRIVVYVVAKDYYEYQNESHDEIFRDLHPYIIIESPIKLLTFIKPKIVEFCTVISLQVILMFHSFMYWEDISNLTDIDCSKDVYFTPSDLRDTSLAWLITFVVILLFLYLSIKSLNALRDKMISQTINGLQIKNSGDIIDTNELLLKEFFEAYGDNASIKTYENLDQSDVTNPNTLCTLLILFFTYVVWVFLSLLIPFVAVIISFKIDTKQCILITYNSSTLINKLNSNKNMIKNVNITYMMIECVILSLLTIMAVGIIYIYFVEPVFHNYDSKNQYKMPKILICKNITRNKIFYFVIVATFQFLIMFHLYILLGYNVDCGYFFNFQMDKAIITWFIFSIFLIISFVISYRLLYKLHESHITNKIYLTKAFRLFDPLHNTILPQQNDNENNSLVDLGDIYDEMMNTSADQSNNIIDRQTTADQKILLHSIELSPSKKEENKDNNNKTDEYDIHPVCICGEYLTMYADIKRVKYNQESPYISGNPCCNKCSTSISKRFWTCDQGHISLHIDGYYLCSNCVLNDRTNEPDYVDMLTNSILPEATSSIPMFGCFCVLWFIICIVVSSISIAFLFDDNISDIYAECDDSLVINNTNIYAYQIEVIILLVLSVCPCCFIFLVVYLLFVCMEERASEALGYRVAVSLFGCILCTQFSIISHLFYVFYYVDCNKKALNHLPSSTKKLSKVYLALVTFFILSICIVILIYKQLRHAILHKVKQINDSSTNVDTKHYYQISEQIWSKISKLSVVFLQSLLIVLTATFIIVTIIVSCMSLTMSLSNNVIRCDNHDWFGRSVGIGVCTFALMLAFMTSIFLVRFLRHLMEFKYDFWLMKYAFYSPISILTKHKNMYLLYCWILTIEFFLVCHQFTYWNSLERSDCESNTFYTIKDIGNILILWIILVVIIIICLVYIIKQYNNVRNIILSEIEQQIKNFDKCKQYSFIVSFFKDYIHSEVTVDPHETTSIVLILFVFITNNLLILWIFLSFITSALILVIALNQYIPFFSIEKIDDSSN
eukprot:80431_1